MRDLREADRMIGGETMLVEDHRNLDVSKLTRNRLTLREKAKAHVKRIIVDQVLLIHNQGPGACITENSK